MVLSRILYVKIPLVVTAVYVSSFIVANRTYALGVSISQWMYSFEHVDIKALQYEMLERIN